MNVKIGRNARSVSLALTGIALGLLAFAGKPVRAQNVYGITNTGNFGILNLDTGSFDQRANYSTTTFGRFFGLAFNKANGNVFAIDGNNVLYQFGTNDSSFSIAQQFQYNAAALNNQIIQSIAFDKITGQLYGLATDNNATGTNATLYQLSNNNPNGVTQVGAFGGLGFNSFGGFAIVSANGMSTGYATQGRASDSTNGPVFQIDLAMGTSQVLGGQNVAGFTNPVSALAGVAGALKAVDYTSDTSIVNRTYNVGLTAPNTGLATGQATYDMNTFGGFLAITDIGQLTTPEPGTLGLLALGLTGGAGGVWVRRRKK